MESDIEKVLSERGTRYGNFMDHAHISQSMKEILRDGVSWPDMDTDQQEALDMIVHKIARIVNGDPYYKDSWTDIIGYARLVEQRLI